MRRWTVYVAEDDGGGDPFGVKATPVDTLRLSAVTGHGGDLYPNDYQLWDGMAHSYEQAVRRARGYLRTHDPDWW